MHSWFDSPPAAALFSAVLLLLVLAPLAENAASKPQDSFPFSYYPMFSHKRSANYSQPFLEGVNADGTTVRIHYTHAGNGGFNQVRRQIRRQIKEGRADELCSRVAGSVATSRSSRYRDISQVRIVDADFVVADYFRKGQKEPVKRSVEAACAVERSV